MMYPPDWPKCPHCGEPCMDGKATCGDVRCVSAEHHSIELSESEPGGGRAEPKYYIKRIDENGATKYAYCDWTGVDPKWRFSPAFALAYPFCNQADATKVAVTLPVDAEIVSAHVRAGK